MNRRGFLGTLLASVGALAIDPASLLWKPAEIEGLPLLVPGALVSLNAITKFVARELALRWQGREIVSSGKIGLDGMLNQFNIAARMPTEVREAGLDLSLIQPVAEAFAQQLKHVGATRMGTLELPRQGAEGVVVRIPSAGVVVRGIQQYDLNWDHDVLRFDVLTGA